MNHYYTHNCFKNQGDIPMFKKAYEWLLAQDESNISAIILLALMAGVLVLGVICAP